MALKFDLMVYRIRHVHPPSVAFIAFVKNDLMFVIGNGNSVFGVFRLINNGVILLMPERTRRFVQPFYIAISGINFLERLKQAF